MMALRAPPDGVAMPAIEQPYEIENRITAARLCTFFGSFEVSMMRRTPTGSIIAATVCSPMNAARKPHTVVMPNEIQ